MSEDIKAVVHRWFEEAWNQGREEAIDRMVGPGAVSYGLAESDITVTGPAEFKQFNRTLRGALPDIHITVDDIIAEGDKAAVRLTVEGTHLGGHLGVPPSGRKVRFAGIVIVQVQGEVLIAAWNSWDQLGLLRQVGALEARPPEQSQFMSKA
jgi:predicted ester cyclase